jgi:hypothetical protein
MRVEHREISLFISPPAQGDEGSADNEHGANQPDECPVCGAPVMLPLSEALSTTGISLAELREKIENNRIHLHCTVPGSWWVCKKSLLEIEPQ